MSSKSTRIDWIDYFKGIGIILVVIGHNFLPPDIRKWIYSFHMPLFFFVGGLTINPKRYKDISEFTKKKAVGLLIPYVAINLCTIATWVVFNKILGSSEVSLSTLLYGILYANNDKIPLLCGPSWFIPTLFLSEVVFYILHSILDGNEKLLLCASMALTVLGYIESVVMDGVIRPWHFASVPVAMLFVTLGFIFAGTYKKDDYRGIMERVSWKWIAILLALGTWAGYVNGKVSFGGNNYKSMTLTIIASISLIYAIIFLSMKLPKNRFLSFAGRCSLIWLALHKTILFGIRYIWPTTNKYYLASFKGMIVLFAIMIPLSFIINRYFPFFVGRKSNSIVNKIGLVLYSAITIVLCFMYF